MQVYKFIPEESAGLKKVYMKAMLTVWLIIWCGDISIQN